MLSKFKVKSVGGGNFVTHFQHNRAQSCAPSQIQPSLTEVVCRYFIPLFSYTLKKLFSPVSLATIIVDTSPLRGSFTSIKGLSE